MSDNTWDGKGFPPDDTVCMLLTIEEEVTIIHEITTNHGFDGVTFSWIDSNNNYMVGYSCNPEAFKPIPTKHDEAAKELAEILAALGYTSAKKLAEEIIKAGYRKLEPMNSKFSKGDTYANHDRPGWSSDILIEDRAILCQFHGPTFMKAEALRDEILEILT